MSPLPVPERNTFSNTYSAIKQRKLLAALVAQLDLMPPGIIDTTTTAYYKLKAGTSFVYHGPDAIVITAYSKTGSIDTGASQPTTDITINGTSVLTAPIENVASADTEVAGDIDAANATITDGDTIELSVVTGTNSDAEELHVVIVISPKI